MKFLPVDQKAHVIPDYYRNLFLLMTLCLCDVERMNKHGCLWKVMH